MSFQAGGDEAQAVLAKVAFITQRTNATVFDDLIVLNRPLKVQICGLELSWFRITLAIPVLLLDSCPRDVPRIV